MGLGLQKFAVAMSPLTAMKFRLCPMKSQQRVVYNITNSLLGCVSFSRRKYGSHPASVTAFCRPGRSQYSAFFFFGEARSRNRRRSSELASSTTVPRRSRYIIMKELTRSQTKYLVDALLEP